MCAHENVAGEACDQTIAVVCLDCQLQLAVCWGDEHIPEPLWNRACNEGTGCIPCLQSRQGVCAICGRCEPGAFEPDCWHALAAVIIVDREVEMRNDSMTDSELNSNWALERAGLPYRFGDVAPFSRAWHDAGYAGNE